MAQISIYPTKVMNITQSYKGSYSHSKNYTGTPRDYPIDDNCGSTGRSYFYAPFDCIIKRIYGVGNKGTNTIWIQSTAKVKTPAFTDYVTVMIIHPNDDTLKKLRVGQVFRQGAAMFLEGNDGNATGYHFHISCGRGKFMGNGWRKNSKGRYVIYTSGGAVPPEKAFYADPLITKIKTAKGLVFVRKVSGNSGQGSASGGSGTAANPYKVGKVLTLLVNLNVRTGPGTNYSRKKRSQLTADGKKYSLKGTYAVYKKGTRVTVKAVRSVGSDIWIKTPSGWICAKKGSKIYAK
ncbi:MAG: hypothetical protein ACLSAO_02000 [Anaerovoracaceae bacterium]